LQNGGIDELRKKEMKKIIIYAIGFFILGFAISQLFFSNLQFSTNSKETKNINEEENIQTEGNNVIYTSDSISVFEQPFGTSVLISDLKLNETVWATVYEDINGKLGNILGARIFNPGNYKNETIELLRGTNGDSTYYVKLLRDDGNRDFDRTKDLPIQDLKTKKDIIASFKTTSGMPR